MAPNFKNAIKEDSGYVLMTVMLMLVLMTVIGLAATNTSSVEMQISGNSRRIAEDLFQSEAVMVDRLEKFGEWLTAAFLTADETLANYSVTIDADGDTHNDASVEIRCIVNPAIVIATLSAAANDLPVQPHIASPPPDSGYSVKHFEARKYGITSTSVNQSAVVQTGAWKVFNKF